MISFLPVFPNSFGLISIHCKMKQGKDSIIGRVWDHKKQPLLWIDFYSLHFDGILDVQIKIFAFWHGKNFLFSFFLRNFISGLSCIGICGYVVSVDFFFTTKSNQNIYIYISIFLKHWQKYLYINKTNTTYLLKLHLYLSITRYHKNIIAETLLTRRLIEYKHWFFNR